MAKKKFRPYCLYCSNRMGHQRRNDIIRKSYIPSSLAKLNFSNPPSPHHAASSVMWRNNTTFTYDIITSMSILLLQYKQEGRNFVCRKLFIWISLLFCNCQTVKHIYFACPNKILLSPNLKSNLKTNNFFFYRPHKH